MIDLLDIRLTQLSKCLAEVESGNNASETRLTRVEDAIVDIRAAMEKNDKQFQLIVAKLDELPRLATMLEALVATAAGLAPRSEVDARLQGAEARLSLVERDVRSARVG